MFRSDPMVFCEMYLQPQTAFATMSRLGNMGLVQFMDMNNETPLYLRSYVSEVCRCANLERKMRYVESEMRVDKIDIPYSPVEPDALALQEMIMYESMVEKWETDITEMSANQSKLKQDLLEMKEMRYVLSNIGPMLGTTEIGLQRVLAQYKYGGDSAGGGQLYLMTGVVNRVRSFSFQLMLWRVSRGNIYYRQANYDEVLEDPYQGGDVRKVAFLAFCQGEVLAAKMKKIFSGFRVNIYPCPNTEEERMLLLQKVEDRIVDLEEVLFKAKYFRCRSLRLVRRKWMSAMIQIRKAKAIYHNLNLFSLDITKNCLIGNCWLPQKDLGRVQAMLRNVSEESESNFESFLVVSQTDKEPPTKQRTNKFTRGFQNLINAYGDSKYGEVNPGIFTIVTFPFLFSIMFGDAGHGLIMVGFAIWMIIYEKQFSNQPGSEIWNIFFGGRYVILLLGLFSVFTGFVYNDVFSRAMNLGTSMWGNTLTKKDIMENALINIDAKYRLSPPYVYGIDPMWRVANNQIMTQNSIKMKMSLVVGIIHMLFGIVVSIFNHIYYRKHYLLVLQFIPEFTFLFCMFFWLIFLIFYKWIYFYSGHANTRYGCSCAPQILILFIDMVLYSSTEKKPPEKGCSIYLFDSQQIIQTILVTISLVMVPVLLFGSPIYITCRNKRMRKKIMGEMTTFRKYQRSSDEVDLVDLKAKLARYQVPFSELMIHQAVHTIEFVLSTISHTASYLRLWALSLAHSHFERHGKGHRFMVNIPKISTKRFHFVRTVKMWNTLPEWFNLGVFKTRVNRYLLELADMLWVMILSKLSLQDHSNKGILKIFFIFPVWAFFTIAILVVMEGLSAFLHTLRLHWVEFMSKCFIGEGYPFKPFYFKDILSVELKSEGFCSAKGTKRERHEMKSINVTNV